MNVEKIAQARRTLYAELRPFMPMSQINSLAACLRGEEADFFASKLITLAKMIEGMPKTYEQDGKGKDAIVYLHYFRGGTDVFITEKDKSADDPDEPGHHQAFGWTSLRGHVRDGEFGYVSLPEILGAGLELDLYFDTRPLSQILKGS